MQMKKACIKRTSLHLKMQMKKTCIIKKHVL